MPHHQRLERPVRPHRIQPTSRARIRHRTRLRQSPSIVALRRWPALQTRSTPRAPPQMQSRYSAARPFSSAARYCSTPAPVTVDPAGISRRTRIARSARRLTCSSEYDPSGANASTTIPRPLLRSPSAYRALGPAHPRQRIHQAQPANPHHSHLQTTPPNESSPQTECPPSPTAPSDSAPAPFAPLSALAVVLHAPPRRLHRQPHLSLQLMCPHALRFTRQRSHTELSSNALPQ